MYIYRLGDMVDKKELLRTLGVQSAGIAIMAKKMQLYYFYIKELRTPAINILKQDALSIGAELAVPSGVITCSKEHYDCILIGNKKHIEILSKKELTQPFGLKRVAEELGRSLHPRTHQVEIMGIINANSDSFFAGSRFVAEDAIVEIKQMIKSGASIIDIGAVSSRPGAASVHQNEELERIRPICDAIEDQKLYKQALFSVDSYTPSVIEYALQKGFGLVNDITGACDDAVIELSHRYGAKLCIMHMQGRPQTMQLDPYYDDVMTTVDSFFEERISKCESLGLNREDIILDVGIGFGKSLEHNLTLIKNLQHFQRFGCQILIGASRKSLIDKITPTPIEERLAGTLALHLKAIEHGATIVRCHDVAAHDQAVKVWRELH